MTHEWGHVFGLDRVPEDGNRNQTVSPVINGTCQSSERSLGGPSAAATTSNPCSRRQKKIRGEAASPTTNETPGP